MTEIERNTVGRCWTGCAAECEASFYCIRQASNAA